MFSPATIAAIEKIREELGLASNTDVLKRGIAILIVSSEEAKTGGSLCVVKADGTIQRLVGV